MGVHHDVYMKALLMHIAHNLYNMFDGKYRLEWLPTWKNKERGECWSAFRNRTFKQLTGFDYTRVKEINADLARMQVVVLKIEGTAASRPPSGARRRESHAD